VGAPAKGWLAKAGETNGEERQVSGRKQIKQRNKQINKTNKSLPRF
jgi:hypothetical protein